MPGGYLYGWYETGAAWIKVQCTAAGKLLADISAFLENPPTEDEAAKAASSEWSFDHDADPDAHHAAYTDADAVDSFTNRSITVTTGTWDAVDVANVNFIYCDTSGGNIHFRGLSNGVEGQIIFMLKFDPDNVVYWSPQVGAVAVGDRIQTPGGLMIYLAGARVGMLFIVYKGAQWVMSAYPFGRVQDFLQEVPANNEYNKAPSSNWAFDHKADVDAHHAKYTDLEAQTAVKLNGTLYWSCAGNNFKPFQPTVHDVQFASNGRLLADADGINTLASVNLPNGATVTGVIVYGDTAAEAETFTLSRILLTDLTGVSMGTANINTEDTSISYETIDNSLYAYLIYTSSLDTGDEIYGARISFTL